MKKTVSDKAPEKQAGILLREKMKTLSLAESCTGGLVSSLVTDVPGCSEFFLGGIVSYSNKIKIEQLGVPADIIDRYGAVSPEVAELMAKGIRKVFGSEISASITGIAGPLGASEEKPVGLAYIGFDNGKERRIKKVIFSGTRKELKRKFAEAVIRFIADNTR